MRRFLLALLCVATGLATYAQTGCPALEAPKPDPSIILTSKQETELGAIMAEELNSRFDVIDDEALTGYLTRVGNRVAAQLPQTGLHYSYVLYDQPEIQAFGVSGGHIYVSRKMVAFLKSEDELAGLLGHELGHLAAHAQDFSDSQMFRVVLGMTSVPENENLFDRYNQILEMSQLKKVNFSYAREEREQLKADQLGLQAVVRAGYVPEAFPDLLDRVLETKGNTGNWFSDLFGSTTASSKRLREALRNLSSLPAACIAKDFKRDPQEFTAWQSAVLHYQGIGHTEKVTGVAMRRTLANPLRGDISSFRFSHDGKYLLAQDEGGIYVLTRDPLKFLFRIDAPDAAPAQFSPDSQTVVFFSSRLRVETWDVLRQILTSVADVPSQRGCRQSALSPNARFLACFQNDLSLALFEVATGQKLLEKAAFFDFDGGLSGYAGFSKFLYFLTHREVVSLQFSPDEHYFAAASRTGEYAVFDLQGRQSIKVPGTLQTAMRHSFTFVKPDVIVGIDEFQPQKSPVAEFPSGKVLDHVPLGDTTLYATENPKYVLVRPVVDRPVGVYDLEKKRVVYSNRTSALDVWGEEAASERLTGEIGIYKTSEAKRSRTEWLCCLWETWGGWPQPPHRRI